ncbi:hypothetical protein BDM02DRAFT_3193762 [Thelephora ganbajun]|uniref:Uncharacterized protein n=1 Tax=Thelephora ganbajun TaxID=370292 RepID=A0ACB6YXL8_THEGA|nr:hypothetical protein BDM02DRAFT_3193762 [Thelephora ganbajun]
MSLICCLEFQFSPDVEWTLVSHTHVLVILLHSPSHKRRFLKIASRKARLGYSHLLLTHHLLDHPLLILPFWTMDGLDLELELAWEQREFQASSRYVSMEGAAGEGDVGVEEGVGEEELMDEEGLWSPNSSDRAVLALVPDTAAFPTQ